MSVIMITLACSCGGNKNGHSKAFNKAMKVYDDMFESVEKASTCEDVDMVIFGAFALIGIDGIDKLNEAETKEFEELGEKLSKAMEAKKAELNCPEEEDFFGGDDDAPFDEETDEME